MLYSIEGNEIERMPHEESYNHYRSRLSEDDYNEIVDEIFRRIGDKEVFNAAHIGSKPEWENTPLMKVYAACDYDEETAGMFFGQLVWQAMIDDDPQEWMFRKEVNPDGTPGGMTYWRTIIQH